MKTKQTNERVLYMAAFGILVFAYRLPDSASGSLLVRRHGTCA